MDDALQLLTNAERNKVPHLYLPQKALFLSSGKVADWTPLRLQRSGDYVHRYATTYSANDQVHEEKIAETALAP